MKISNNIPVALQDSEARRKAKGATEGFDALLSEQLGGEENQDAVSAATSAGVGMGLLQGMTPSSLAAAGQSGELSALSAMQSLLGDASDQVEDMFDGLEKYAGSLSSSDPTAMRAAHSHLEDMTAKITAFRAAFPDMEKQSPELASMVNELDVLATTERFKFNRGDYL